MPRSSAPLHHCPIHPCARTCRSEWETPCKAIAVSLASYRKAEFAFAAGVAARVAKEVIEHGLPDQTLLNVNVPAVPEDEIAGVMVTRMGLRIYYDELVRRLDPRGRPYYWIGGQEPGGVLEEGTDLWAVAHNYVSVTPIQLDLTAHEQIERVRAWGLGVQKS